MQRKYTWGVCRLGRAKYIMVAAGIAIAATILAKASASRFQEPAFYVGPDSFTAGTASALQALGAQQVSAAALPSTLSQRSMFIFGRCPATLGVTSDQLLQWLEQGATVVAMDCSEVGRRWPRAATP